MNISAKPVKSLTECMEARLFLIPRSKANDIDIKTGERCVFVGINGNATYVPVGRPTPISYNVFCVLRDLQMISYANTFEEGTEITSL